MSRRSLAIAIVLAAGCGARSTLNDLVDVDIGSGRDGGVSTFADGGSNSSCQDEIIAKDANGAVSLAVDGDTVFWANGDNVLQIHDTNGSRILATESLTISSIAFDGARVYYTIANAVRSISRGGGAPTTIATGVGYAFGMVNAGATLYMLDRGSGIIDGRVLRVDPDGSVHELLTDLDIPTGLAMDGDSLYAAAVAGAPPDGGNDEGPLYRIAKDGSAVTFLANGLYGPSSVGVDATRVFVAAQLQDNAEALGTLLSVPKSGGSFTTVITPGEALGLDVTLDNDIAYMTTYAVPGDTSSAIATLLRIPVDGSGSTTLATTSHVVYGYVRTSPTAIYWTIDWLSNEPPDDGASVRKKCK